MSRQGVATYLECESRRQREKGTAMQSEYEAHKNSRILGWMTLCFGLIVAVVVVGVVLSMP